MAASEASASPRRTKARALAAPLFGGAIAAALLCFFPLFHVAPLRPAAPAVSEGATTPFDGKAAADRIWKTEIPAAAKQATDLRALAAAIRSNPATAQAQFGKTAGFGAAHYFTKGSGKVTKIERNYLHLAIEGAESETVALRIGPVFGNTVRDGCGLLDVNAFPGLQEFNALSADLNGRVEKEVIPPLREKAKVGSVIQFAGCAEAPESAADAGEPLLLVIPIQADVRP